MENNVRIGGRYNHYLNDLRRYYKNPVAQASLTTVLSILLVVVFIVTAIKPTLETIANLNKSIEATEKTLDKLKQKEKAVQQAALIYERIVPKLMYLESAIPTSGPEYDKLVKSMEIIANRVGVTLSNQSVGGAILYSEIYDPYTGVSRKVIKMPISTKVSGDYQKLRQFLFELNNIDRLIEIQNISINRDAANRSSNQESLAMSITGYASYLGDETIIKQVVEGKGKNDQ